VGGDSSNAARSLYYYESRREMQERNLSVDACTILGEVAVQRKEKGVGSVFHP
jgi:hypothetical protein